jgi:sRNA-binding carbon storage regulator CsrA
MLEVTHCVRSAFLIGDGVTVKVLSTAGNTARISVSVKHRSEIRFGAGTGRNIGEMIKPGSSIQVRDGQSLIIDSLIEITVKESQKTKVTFIIDAPDFILHPQLSGEDHLISHQVEPNTSDAKTPPTRNIQKFRAGLGLR